MSEILSRCGYRCDLCLAYQPNIQAHLKRQLISDGWFVLRLPRPARKDKYRDAHRGLVGVI